MVFLPPTEVEERYSADYNKQFKTVINGILSGLEGLFQDQWALCTAVRLVVVMVDRLQCDGVMIEKGDDIIVSVLLDLPDGLSSVSNLCEVKPEAVCLASDRLKEARATALQEVNLTLKPDQTLVTLDYQIFGKEFIKEGCLLPRHFKQISRLFLTGSDGYPKLDNCLGQLSSASISAALGVHDHTPIFMMYLFNFARALNP